jgi:hypothetical protein
MTSHAPTLDDMVSAFKSLSTSERQTFITTISRQFNYSDWRHVRQLVSARDVEGGHRDPARVLPLELAIHMVEYLSPYDLASCRLVNKHWNMLFSTEDVCRAIVQRWYPRDAVHVTERSWRWILENAASREARILHSVDPISFLVQEPYVESLIAPVQERPSPVLGAHTSFMGRLVACIDPEDPRFLYIYDLVSYSRVGERLATPARNTLQAVCLMEDYVMATSYDSATVYVWNLETLELKMARLTNADHGPATADGNIVALTYLGPERHVWLYDPTVNDFTVITVGQYKVHQVILDAHNKRATLISYDKVPFTLYAITYSTTGEFLERQQFSMPAEDVSGCEILTNKRCGEHLFIVRMGGHVRVMNDESSGFYSYALLFDRKARRFVEQRLRFEQILNVPEEVYMYEGTVYAVFDNPVASLGAIIGMRVPMSTGKDWFTVETMPKAISQRECLPVHTVSPGRIVCRQRNPGLPAGSVRYLELHVFKGIHEDSVPDELVSAEQRKDLVYVGNPDAMWWL